MIEAASAQPVLSTVTPRPGDLALGEEMISLAAGTSTDGGSDESAEHEAARLVHDVTGRSVSALTGVGNLHGY